MTFDGTASYRHWLAALDREDAALAATIQLWVSCSKANEHVRRERGRQHESDVAYRVGRVLTQLSIEVQNLMRIHGFPARLLVGTEAEGSGTAAGQLSDLLEECLVLAGELEPEAEVPKLRPMFASAIAEGVLAVPGFHVEHAPGGLVLTPLPPPTALPPE